MKIALSTIITAFLLTTAHCVQSQDFTGSWTGSLDFGKEKLTVNIHIKQGDHGILTGTFDSPDQGAYDLPFQSVETKDVQLICLEKRMNIKLVAEFVGDDDLEASWTQGGQAFPISFRRLEGEVVDKSKLQDPVPPFPYEEEELWFINTKGDTLYGTLTHPKGKKKAPGIILITGSGPQDRNSEILGHRPFFVLSDYLTRQGIAVFRYDERGVGMSGGDFSTATSEDFAKDAAEALKRMACHPNVDNKRLGVFGHSEGGIVAPLMNASFLQPHFLILAAAPGVPSRDLLLMQNDKIGEVQGLTKKQRERSREENTALFDLIIESANIEDAHTKINQYFDEKIEGSKEISDVKRLEQLRKSVHTSMLTPWFDYFIRYQPEAHLRSIQTPTLAINGKLDVQVPWEENTREIREAFEKSGNTNLHIKTYDALNHLFQTAKTGSPMEYAQNTETFNEEVMADIAEFILGQKKGKRINLR